MLSRDEVALLMILQDLSHAVEAHFLASMTLKSAGGGPSAEGSFWTVAAPKTFVGRVCRRTISPTP